MNKQAQGAVEEPLPALSKTKRGWSGVLCLTDIHDHLKERERQLREALTRIRQVGEERDQLLANVWPFDADQEETLKHVIEMGREDGNIASIHVDRLVSMAACINAQRVRVAELEEERDTARAAHGKTMLLLHEAAFETIPAFEAKVAELEAQVEAARRILRGSYLAWTNAGGPDECAHGRADGIPCRQCDWEVLFRPAQEEEQKP